MCERFQVKSKKKLSKSKRGEGGLISRSIYGVVLPRNLLEIEVQKYSDLN